VGRAGLELRPTDHESVQAWRDLGCPATWVEAVYPGLAYFNKVDKGGHFAAWEEPGISTTEVRAAFRSLR
jgi:hypothetical protein